MSKGCRRSKYLGEVFPNRGVIAIIRSLLSYTGSRKKESWRYVSEFRLAPYRIVYSLSLGKIKEFR